MTYAERAAKYAREVVAGKVLACKWVKLACERHLSDLKASKAKDYPYRFDAERANKVCRFLELLPHIKGIWAARREKIRLEDWQCFIECVPFGWVRKSDGMRRFRRVYIEVPRKNSKSTVTAGNGLYMLTSDGEFGAEVYAGAGSQKQAWEVFGPARLMAMKTPELQQAFSLEVNAQSLVITGKGSKFEPIIGKPGDGASPSFSITDEYHEHPTDEQLDTMLTGMGAREQPMAWIITTAGVDTASPCYALRKEVIDTLEGTVANDRLFGVIYTVDEGDPWDTEESLRKANPNYGVSVFADYLKGQQEDAINEPRKQSTFKTKHLNLWVGASSPYFNLERWNQLSDAPPLETFHGEPCWLGLDLAAKLDLCAVVKLFRRTIGEKVHYFAYLTAYCPEEKIHEPDRRHYETWALQGHLTSTPGNVTDYDQIEADVIADSERFRIVELGFDPYNATQLTTHLAAKGVTCIEVPQTVPHLSEPMKWVQAHIVDGTIHHDGNPVFAWAIGNVTAQVDRNENVFPRKERPENKIDPAVALIIGTGRCMNETPAPSYSLNFLG